MDCRGKYVSELLPNYDLMIDSLDNEDVGAGISLHHVKTVCGILNDLIDYCADEYPEYIKNKWQAHNKKEFRDNLENHQHMFFNIVCDGLFFGFIRDVANVTKHKKIGRPEALFRDVNDIHEAIILIRHQDEKGYYYSTRKAVTIDTLEGSRVLIESFVLLAISSFTNILIEAGAIPELPNCGIRKRIFQVSREQVALLPKVLISGNVGNKVNIALGNYIYIKSPVFELRGSQPDDVFEGTTSLMDAHIKPSLFESEYTEK